MPKVPQASIKLSSNWREISTMLSPAKVDARVRLNVRSATAYNAGLVRKQARSVIQGGMEPKNAALTKFIKRSSKPLADNAELYKAITSIVTNAFTAEIGVRKGDSTANTAVAVHEGARVKVTPAMRAMFARLHEVSEGGASPSTLTGRAAELWKRRPRRGWKPLRKGTTHIRIPPRPFMAVAMDDKAMLDRMAKAWSDAYAASIAGETWTARRLG